MVEKKDFIEWMTHWFQKKIGVVLCDWECNFFSAGLLNSFTTLELVTDMESFLNIVLPDSALSDSRFSNVNGLINILSELGVIGE